MVTLAPILKREDGRIDFTDHTAKEIYDRWRGFYPWPGTYADFRGKRFLIHRMHLPEENSGLPCGALSWDESNLKVGAAEGTTLILDQVQLEGKQQLKGLDFVRGFQVKQGETLA